MKISRSRIRAIAAAAAAGLILSVSSAAPANAVTILNRYERTCDQNGRGCGGWRLVSGARSSDVGSTCIQYNRQYGWAWVVGTISRTYPWAGADCRWT